MNDLPHRVPLLDRIISEIDELLVDAFRWNDAHPEEVPFDVGADLCVLAVARDLREALLDNDSARAQCLSAELQRLERIAVAVNDEEIRAAQSPGEQADG